jgi:hypothetical protein
MQLFCPSCQAAFPGVSRCPRCGGLLLMPHEVAPDTSRRRFSPPPPKLKPTAVGRVAIGTVLALGFYLGVRKIVTGAVMAAVNDPGAWWLSFHGLIAVYSTQAVAVVCGATISAAGRIRGFAHGLGVGVMCGGLFLGFELLAGVPPQDLVIYLQPPVLALLGLVAGVVGARIWGVSPTPDIPLPQLSKLSSIQFAKETVTNREKPTIWLRVLVGASIMVAGVAIADEARTFAQRNSAGLLRVQNLGQGEFITFQLATFAVLLGGIVAGAGTGAGLRHGLYSGALGGIGVLGICLKHGDAILPIAYWLARVSMEELPLMAPSVCVTVFGSILMVGLVGGWLGGALFLPLVPEHLRGRFQIGGD